MSEKKRARRRRDTARMKARAAFYLRHVCDYEEHEVTPRHVGRMAATHCKSCSCWMGCGNRRQWEGRSIAERRAATYYPNDN